MKYRDKILYVAVILCVLVAILFIKGRYDSGSDEYLLIKDEKNEVINRGTVMVHIDGYVKNPGLYELEENMRVSDVIEAAGGLLADADASAINLAEIVHDEDKIHVPKLGEDVVASSGTTVIRLNSATKEELMSLPGIGEVLAQNIIDYRNKNRFKSVEDLKNVSGIGDKLYERICDSVRP